MKPKKCDDHWFVQACGRGYIVCNKHRGFDNSHTHVRNMSAANALIKVCRLGVTPRHWSTRMLQSLARVADYEHAQRIEALLNEKLHKGKQKYNNRRVV